MTKRIARADEESFDLRVLKTPKELELRPQVEEGQPVTRGSFDLSAAKALKEIDSSETGGMPTPKNHERSNRVSEVRKPIFYILKVDYARIKNRSPAYESKHLIDFILIDVNCLPVKTSLTITSCPLTTSKTNLSPFDNV